jgi:hypothetical protein
MIDIESLPFLISYEIEGIDKTCTKLLNRLCESSYADCTGMLIELTIYIKMTESSIVVLLSYV